MSFDLYCSKKVGDEVELEVPEDHLDRTERGGEGFPNESDEFDVDFCTDVDKRTPWLQVLESSIREGGASALTRNDERRRVSS